MEVTDGHRLVRLRAVAISVAALVAVAGAGTVGAGTALRSRADRPVALATAARHPAPPDSPLVVAAARRAQAVALLARRADALRTGDRAAWMATVDPTSPSERARQAVLFANLRQLPWAVYRWAPTPGSDAEGYLVPDGQLAGAAAGYLPAMRLTYQLSGYDPVAQNAAYVPLLLQRDGRWYVAGDRTSGYAAVDEVQPWDLGPVAVFRGPHVLTVVSAADAGRLHRLARQAEHAIVSVRRMWPQRWDGRAVLLDTSDPRVFRSYLGSFGGVERTSAVTVTQGGGQAGSVSDARVVLNPAQSAPGSSGMTDLLTHEFTHVATRSVEAAGTPVWAVEGIAEFTAYRGHPQDQRVSNQLLARARAHSLGPLPRSAGFYGPNESTQSFHYGYSWLAWEYVSETFGDGRVRALYARLATIGAPRDSAAAAAAEAAAFRAVLHESEPSFVRHLDGWIASVLHRAG